MTNSGANWFGLSRIFRSITLTAATLIGVVTTIMLVCAAALLIRLGGDDDGTWAAANVANTLAAAAARNDQRQLIITQTPKLQEIISEFPSFWYVVSDQTSEVSAGPVPIWRPRKSESQRNGTSFLAFAIDGDTRKLKRITASRNTPVGEIWIETGGVAYTARQLVLGTLTEATIVVLPILLLLMTTALAALVFVPALIARPVRAVAAAAETIDGVPDGRRLPEENAPTELLPLVLAFNRALARIDNASKLQRNFLSNAAHELRTPLTNARTALEQIPDAALRARVVAENEKLSAIVTMLLQLARISMEPAELTKVDLVALTRRIAAEHVPMALKNGSSIVFTEPGHPVSALGSETAVAIALSNLIRNAIHHAESDRPILIEVSEPARICVIDHGPGLGLFKPDASFEPFKRGNTAAQGMGLGLSIVSQVMTTHNGGIRVQETPGGGTTVELNFPAMRDPPEL
ncbi:HAMP domain-containing histidine kinase [Bradyrhizobium huanghuaihaiense]|uniref:sensor histidine kinase n=1 Tax=Bradyrhizobium huanghuaihaiense TaxID=990078 RepID=UPI0021AA2C81|nr:HAMP domain-containing sensor histidine kinase [Bradyrhizobium sp. CB3035]UWU78741.1 HAMP domain-containing histidine kinase [Bradyrhizobium sp. CB3035]